ncbi:hypothetical protein AVEN_43729-1 [Araneus ventricosus]|uniref:Uncharacterized protein n=1 Tax=Araneus ventricosus TaxID=182803 RepID=A0A4Y2BY68_ARAVE|nr:hypothetical protein AVEN_43729-1 [Araneus ventricosus]
MYSGEVFFRFHSKIEGVGVGQATLDDISRRHKLPYEITIVEIRRVVAAGGFLQCLPIDKYRGEVFFFLSRSKMVGGVGKETLDNISKHHNLSYEIKIVEIGLVVGAEELIEGFTKLF